MRLSSEEVSFEGRYRCPDAEFGEFSVSFWCPAIAAVPVQDSCVSAWLCFLPFFLRALCRGLFGFEFASSFDSVSVSESAGFIGGCKAGSAGPPPLASDLPQVAG